MHRSLILACAVVLAGCGGATKAHQAPAHHPSQAERMKTIVREWSNRLNAGDNKGIVRLFALPARMVQGGYVFVLTKPSQIAEWHAGLPCSGQVVSIAVRANTATAVFRLGHRKGLKCDAPGTLAAARFTFIGGKIAQWAQIAVPVAPTA